MTDLAATDPGVLALVAAVLTLAGVVKGVVGLGLPTVTLALLTATLGLEPAIAIMLLPSLVTNVWQTMAGGRLGMLVLRFWPFHLSLVVGVLLASAAGAAIATSTLTILLGVVTALYGLAGLATPPWPSPGKWEGPLSSPMGLATGILTGLTGSFVMPAVPYLQSLGLPRDRLVQVMGMTFLTATLALAAGFGGRGLLPGNLIALSAFAVLPALVGMEIGRRIRGRLSEPRFRQALFAALLMLGLWIVLAAWT